MHETVAAYRAATYALRLHGGRRAVLRIDTPAPSPLDEFLRLNTGHETVFGGFITAWNPFSQPASRNDNRRRQRELLARLRASAATVFVGAGCGTGWREPSFAVLGIELDMLDDLARTFRQNAILTFRAQESVRLRLYRDDWRAALVDADLDFAPAS